MPNRIINHLSARGDPAHIRQFLDEMNCEHGPLDFDRIFGPRPKTVRDPSEEFVDPAIAEWGTGNPCDFELVDSTAEWGCIVIKFETPWLPPGQGLLRRLRALFPDIVFDLDWYDFDCDVEERFGFKRRDGSSHL